MFGIIDYITIIFTIIFVTSYLIRSFLKLFTLFERLFLITVSARHPNRPD